MNIIFLLCSLHISCRNVCQIQAFFLCRRILSLPVLPSLTSRSLWKMGLVVWYHCTNKWLLLRVSMFSSRRIRNAKAWAVYSCKLMEFIGVFPYNTLLSKYIFSHWEQKYQILRERRTKWKAATIFVCYCTTVISRSNIILKYFTQAVAELK